MFSLGGAMRLSMGEEVRVRDQLPFSGIIPVNLLPFMPDYSIDQVVAVQEGMGSVAADLQAELFANVQRGVLDAAREVNDRLDPLVRVLYAPPCVDMHNRMKEALALLGRLERAVVRPPLQPISAAERTQIGEALARAGLLEPVAAV